MQSLLVLLLLSSFMCNAENAIAQHDTILESHTKVLKPKFKFRSPKIISTDFCDSLHALKGLGLEILRRDREKPLELFLEFDVVFTRQLSPKITSHLNISDSSYDKITVRINHLLRHAKWDVDPASYGHIISLRFTLEKDGIWSANLVSWDNADAKTICD